jgi:hypothetical protein
MVGALVGTNQREQVTLWNGLMHSFDFRKNVVCPIIDVVNDRTFAYQKGIELFRGGFNWNLQVGVLTLVSNCTLNLVPMVRRSSKNFQRTRQRSDGAN